MPTATATRAHYTARAKQYATEVLSGKVPACRWVQLAAQRHLDDLTRAAEPGAAYYFDTKAANRVCDIIERFPHIKGIWAQNRNKLALEPWQCFIVCSVFGWKWRGTDQRRFRVAYIEVPRKNAKSTTTSAVGLYLAFCDGEHGAQVVSAANTRDQAKLLFTDAQLMARREPGFRQKFGVDVLAHSIVQKETSSSFHALSAEHSNLDGLNLHAALIDELHAHPSRGLWDVLETATGSRAQPLIWAITTAGLNRASVCYEQRAHVLDILEGRVADDTYFGIVYTKDDGDDPWEAATWCLAGNTRVYAQINRGPTVCALREVCRHAETTQVWTGTEWSQVRNWSSCREENGFRLRFRSGETICATAHHQWPTRRGAVRTDALVVGDIVTTTNLPDVCCDLAKLIPAEVGYLVGLYLAEGSRHEGTIQLAGHSRETEDRLAQVRPIVQSYHGSVGAHAYGNKGIIRIECRILSTILDLYIGGDTAKTKFLKPAIWRRSTEFLRRVADGYLDGDGALDKENDRWRLGFCANDKLTESLRTLGARTGARVHLKPSKSRDQTGKRHPIRRGEWRWQTTDRSLPPGELLGIERRPDAEEYFHITIDDPAGIWTLASGLQTYNSKCNPNYGISIYPESIQAEARRAQVMASAQGTFLTKHCNVWISADSAWLPAGAWEKCADRELDIEDFTGQPCYLGIDLALRSDIAALMTVFPPHGEREYWAVFGRYFLPEQTVNRSENQHYQGWEATGRLTATPGAITDFDFIIAAIADHAERFQIIEITIDPYDAGPLIATLEREGLPKPIEVRQSAANMSPAMIELEGIVIGGTIRHDGDPVLAWMFANVNCRRSSDDLLFPKKAGEEKKIDGVTATLMCIHRALKAPAIAEGRGAWVISMEDE